MYERDDFLLIRDEKVIAVSANEDFNDGDNPTEVLDTDTVVMVVCQGNQIPYLAANPYEQKDNTVKFSNETLFHSFLVLSGLMAGSLFTLIMLLNQCY